MVRYSKGYLEAIATGLSVFGPSDLPELPQTVPSIQSILKLGMLEGLFIKLKPLPSSAMRQLARRSYSAQQAYSDLRQTLEKYFENFCSESPKFGIYFRALNHAEALVLHLHIAHDSLKSISNLMPITDDDKFFPKINDLANEIKHLGGRRKAICANPSANLPMYFLDKGITNGKSYLSFSEICENLNFLSVATNELIDHFSEMNPLHKVLHFK